MLDHTDLEHEASKLTEIDLKRTLCFQDTVHIGTKFRNRLLAAPITITLGNSVVSLSHLKILLNNVPKDIHGLTMKDICPDDHQNYGSLEKMMKHSFKCTRRIRYWK